MLTNLSAQNTKSPLLVVLSETERGQLNLLLQIHTHYYYYYGSRGLMDRVGLLIQRSRVRVCRCITSAVRLKYLDWYLRDQTPRVPGRRSVGCPLLRACVHALVRCLCIHACMYQENLKKTQQIPCVCAS